MYVRQQNANHSRVKIPDNYGGNAFSSSYYNDMPPPARQSAPPKSDFESRLPPSPPPIDIPPKSSPLADKLRNPQAFIPEAIERDEYINVPPESELIDTAPPPPKIPKEELETEKPSRQELGTPSLLSSLIPKMSVSGNFPFGHGIGGEELLILGMMLLIYLSGSERGEIDGEFIILLGLLLFAG